MSAPACKWLMLWKCLPSSTCSIFMHAAGRQVQLELHINNDRGTAMHELQWMRRRKLSRAQQVGQRRSTLQSAWARCMPTLQRVLATGVTTWACRSGWTLSPISLCLAGRRRRCDCS